MIISEKQIMQLITIASEYVKTIELMIQQEIAKGKPKERIIYIENIIKTIEDQQSEELKKIE